METISAADRAILRELAAKQRQYAESPAMKQLEADWFKLNTFRGGRPLVQLELWTFGDEVITPRMRCTGDTARSIENRLLRGYLNHELFADDCLVQPYFPVQWSSYFIPFGVEIPVTHAVDAQGRNVGYAFTYPIVDLERDIEKLGPSRYGADRKETQEALDFYNDIFGDVLPAKMTGRSPAISPSYDMLRLMGTEAMFTNMCDYPELFAETTNRLADDWLAYYDFLTAEGLLLPTCAGEWLGQGSLCYTDELPAEAKSTRDIWLHSNAQETVGLSPTMFAELFFPSYQKLFERFGLVSFGCCEPVDGIWENCLSKAPNLRKVSISPWCNEKYIGEQLRGKKIVYFRKPTPNLLGVGGTLDEDAVRAMMRTTLEAAQGCTLEFAQRDVYTIGHDVAKARRYVALMHEEIEQHWKG